MATAMRFFYKGPPGSVLRLLCKEQYAAGPLVEKAFLARTATEVREIVWASSVLGIDPLELTIEPEEGFFYVWISDENEDSIYLQTPKARVIAMFQENLDASEYARAIAWLESDLLFPFQSEDGRMFVS
jgi:hypothetical protein